MYINFLYFANSFMYFYILYKIMKKVIKNTIL